MFPTIQFFGNVKFNENLGHQNYYRPLKTNSNSSYFRGIVITKESFFISETKKSIRYCLGIFIPFLGMQKVNHDLPWSSSRFGFSFFLF